MKKAIRWPYYIWMYFDILKKLNSNYRKLNNLDGKNNNQKREKLYYEIFEEITQIIPCHINDGTLKIRNQGILELLGDDEKFVKTFLEDMINSEELYLYDIRQIRNNIEHSPHRLLICAQFGAKGSSNITLNYSRANTNLDNISAKDIECYKCDSKILNEIILKLNTLFKNIRKDIIKLAKSGKVDYELIKIYSRYKLK